MQPEQALQQFPVNVVGGSSFGVWPKISLEKTYNMYISDGWLLSYAGYKKVSDAQNTGKGRGLFRSIRGGFLIAVIGSSVYRVGPSLALEFIDSILTNTGEVFMDENLNYQICIVDGLKAYIYNYTLNSPAIGTLTPQTLTISPPAVPAYDVIPNYVTYHNNQFLIASSKSSPFPQNWYVFIYATPTTIVASPVAPANPIQTKPDNAIAVKRVPGRGNNVIVFGNAVCEIWTQAPVPDITGPPFIAGKNYQKVSSYSIDNGCISVSTIAANEDTICWLAQNENNSAVIMTSNGSETKMISTDGIDHLLESIQHADQSSAFFYKQNGHLFYQLTFTNVADNLTLIYDFSSQQFFHLSDENMNFYPALDVVFFNNNSYFVSLNDSGLYQMGDQFNTYNYSIPDDESATSEEDDPSDGEEIPRIRICKSIRKDDASIFRVGYFTFWLEQGVNKFFSQYDFEGLMVTQSGDLMITEDTGQFMLVEGGGAFLDNNRPRVDMSFSKNGNQSFSNIVSRELNSQAHFRNRINWYRMGQCNEFTIQLRFWGLQRFVASNGVVSLS